MANAEKASKDYREALRVAKIIKNDEYVANMTVHLVELALNREQWVQAESLARESLALAKKSGGRS